MKHDSSAALGVAPATKQPGRSRKLREISAQQGIRPTRICFDQSPAISLCATCATSADRPGTSRAASIDTISSADQSNWRQAIGTSPDTPRGRIDTRSPHLCFPHRDRLARNILHHPAQGKSMVSKRTFFSWDSPLWTSFDSPFFSSFASSIN